MPRRPQTPDKPESKLLQPRTSSLLIQRVYGLAPPRYVEELNLVWTHLTGDWSWIVALPAEPDFSTAEIARALTQVGAWLSASSVDFIEASDIDLDSSTRLIGHLKSPVAGPDAWRDGERRGWTSQTRPVIRTVVALESPMANRIALRVALAADGVVLCMRRGRTPLASIRQSIETLGADRILCCLLIE